MAYHLVRFLEDGIMYVCPASNVRKGVGNIRKVRYGSLGTYDAEIISTGGMSVMIFNEETFLSSFIIFMKLLSIMNIL